MSEIVFILGAGTSREAGAPVMANFLDRADELRRGGVLGEFQQDFDRVFDAISKLQVVHSKARLDLDNIESVFAAFEMAELIGRLPGLESNNVPILLTSVRRLIAKTLEETLVYPVKGRDIMPTPSYQAFAGLLNELVHSGHSCSVITFNYDYALDFALYFNQIPPDYCLPDVTPNNGVIPLMKLHGSLNWAKCSKCGQIIPWDIRDYLSRSNVSLVAHVRSGPLHINLAANLPKSGMKHCGENVCADPVLVPPTWNKAQYHRVLSKVWSRAAVELSTAENIFVSGYSLSETDLFFRYLYALGSVGGARIKRFWVFDPDKESVDRKFRDLLGFGAEARYTCKPSPFSEAINFIRKQFPSQKDL